jgi:hypothetical protein
MMDSMKVRFFSLAAMFLPFAAFGAGLGDIKTVYLLPMPGGLDQYLAVRLTAGSILQVVTDPQKADAIFTDHIGAGLEQTLTDLYADKSKTKDKNDPVDNFGAGKPQAAVSRGRGTVFLIDRKTRNVVWSIWEKPKNSTVEETNHLADKIAGELAKSQKGK